MRGARFNETVEAVHELWLAGCEALDAILELLAAMGSLVLAILAHEPEAA